GRRRAVSMVPRLLQEARSSQSEVRMASLQVLRSLARPSDLPALVDLLQATPAEARDAALEAVAETARRSGEEGQGEKILLERLSAASRPADRAALLTALGQIGGPGTLAALRKALMDPDAGVKATALSLLAEWPTDEPRNDLLQTV